jgi:hypothetical protein
MENSGMPFMTAVVDGNDSAIISRFPLRDVRKVEGRGGAGTFVEAIANIHGVDHLLIGTHYPLQMPACSPLREHPKCESADPEHTFQPRLLLSLQITGLVGSRPELPAIVGGDFNAKPHLPEITMLGSSLWDACDKTPSRLNHFSVTGASPTPFGCDQIDHVWFRGPYQADALDVYIEHTTPWEGVWPGDHGFWLATLRYDAGATWGPPPQPPSSPVDLCHMACANRNGQCRAAGRPGQVCSAEFRDCTDACG